MTDDGLPLIGPVPGVAGAFVATGHGPWGMLNAPATGQALAELIVEGAASSVDLRPVRPRRGWLPPEAGEAPLPRRRMPRAGAGCLGYDSSCPATQLLEGSERGRNP